MIPTLFEVMKVLLLALVFQQKSRMTPAKEWQGGLAARGRGGGCTATQPPPLSRAMLCLGSHLYFPLVLLYQCQHGKIGAKNGAALLNYNKKSCQGCGRLGTQSSCPSPSCRQHLGTSGLMG